MFNEKLIPFLEFWNWNFRMWKRKFYSLNKDFNILLFDFRAVLKSYHVKGFSPSAALIVAYRLGEV